MKRRIALLLVICLLTSMAPAATAGDAVGDDIPGNGIEIVDIGGQDLAEPLESDGIELEVDGLPDEIEDILPGGDLPELELDASLNLTDGDALLSESEALGGSSETNDDSSDFTIEDGVLTKYNGAGGDIVIPNGVTSIGYNSFYEIRNITSLTIPGSVTSIEPHAFYQCSGGSGHTVVNIQDGLVSIGECAFLRCNFDINIPKSVTTIEEGAFSYCKVSVSPENTHYKMEDGFLYTADGKTLLFWQWTGKDVVIPKGTIRIGKMAFYSKYLLNSVSIPDSVTSIGESAFSGCYEMTEINIPDSVTGIGGWAFHYCHGLTDVTIPGSVKTIGRRAFEECEGLKNVIISDGVTKIEAEAFWKCASLESVTIPASITEIEYGVFNECVLVKIKGYTGSCAEIYARENDIPFVSIGKVPQTPAPTATPKPTATPTAKPTTKPISIPKKLTLGVKETYALEAAGASFKSSNKAVAEVSKKGVITAKKTGSATITVTVKGQKAKTCKVTVVKAPTEVSFAEEAVKLGVKETLTLKPVITKKSHAGYTWSSKDKKIATVDKDGVVTGKKAGKTTVTVKTHNGLKATVTVQVQKAPDKVSLKPKSVTLGVKEALTLTPTVTKGSHASYTWSVDDKKIATVNKNGVVTGKKTGETTVTVLTQNGKKATVKVKVVKAPSKISFDIKSMKMGVKESLSLKPVIAKDTHASYTWTVKDKKIATVTKDGKITGVKKGKTTVTVKTHNGMKATLTVNVLAAPDSLALSGKSRTLAVGGVIMLMPKLPKNTASTIKWTSSKKSVATVDADGVVRALKKGKAKITAKTFNGKKAVCTITVNDGAAYITFDQDTVSIGVKEKVTLKPVVNEGAKAKFTWSTKDKAIAKVDQKGVVTGVKAGSTEITVKTQNDLIATVKVKVSAAPSKVTLNQKKAELAEGATLQLKATLPKNTASQIKWSTSAKQVATVDENGLVTAMSKGQAKITAKTFNGKSATCVVKVREATQEDQFSSFWDAYETLEKTNVDSSVIQIELLKQEDFDDSDDTAEFIEKYNGLACSINEEAESYSNCLKELEKALDEMNTSFGAIKIVAEKKSISFTFDGFSFMVPTNIVDIASNNGTSYREAIVSNMSFPEIGPEAVESFVDGAKQCIKIMGDFISEYDIWVKGLDAATLGLPQKVRALCDLIEAKLNDTPKNSKLRKVLEKALSGLKKVAVQSKNLRYAADAVSQMWDEFCKKQVAAGLALGYDAVYAAEVAAIWIHGHPIEGREREDMLRNDYALKLKENIKSTTRWIGGDVAYNVGMVVAEFLLFGKGGAVKLLGKATANKFFILTGEKWLKFAFAGGTLAGSIKIGNEVEKNYNQMKRCDDILHGNIRGTISGKVIDADTKKPIAGVLVETDEKSATTKSDGSFVLSAMYGDYSGKYAVMSRKEKYVDGTGEAKVDEGYTNAVITIKMSVEGIPIDEAHFPDPHFREFVRRFDLDSDGILKKEEIAKATSIKADNSSIASLEGIQYLTELQELHCAGNQLTTLDVSANKALKVLDVGGNRLKGLNVAGHPGLEALYCYNNQANPLEILDASWCPNLRELDCTGEGSGEGSGRVRSLNVCGCARLETLKCGNNHSLRIDMAGCTALKTFACTNNAWNTLNLADSKNLEALYCNYNKLTSMVVSGLANLKTLNCAINQLTTLDVSGLTKLEELNCAGNKLEWLFAGGCTALKRCYCSYNKIKTLTFKACPALEELEYAGNSIEEMDVSGCAKLAQLYVAGTNDARGLLKTLNASGCTSLTTLSCCYNQLTSLNVSGCTSLVGLWCYNNKLTSLNVSGCTSLTELYCDYNQLTSLNVSGLTSLDELCCDSNQLTSLNVSGLKNLGWLNCDGNKLTSLDVSGLTSLKGLSCDSNQLTSLNVRGCTSLVSLWCSNNKLTSLNVSGCTSLEYLDCDHNQLTSLNVSGCTSLQILKCEENKLTNLNVSGFTSLKYVYFSNNPLTSLNASGCTSLTELSCHYDQLTSLNVSGCTSLIELRIDCCQITSLNVSGCTSLIELRIDLSQITSLNVSGCTSLKKLWCEGSQLTSLNVSGCTSLIKLHCKDNQLTNLDVSGTPLYEVYCDQSVRLTPGVWEWVYRYVYSVEYCYGEGLYERKRT